jgi:hypothetical protein
MLSSVAGKWSISPSPKYMFHGLGVASSYVAWASLIGLDETRAHRLSWASSSDRLDNVLARPSSRPIVFPVSVLHNRSNL